MKKSNKPGIIVNIPKNKCSDLHCPFHNNLKTRGRIFIGKVIKKDLHKSATINWERLIYVRKYERYEKKRTRLRVHNPPCVNAKVNDFVKVMECRPISKSKKFVILENFKK